ncbi:zinc transporter ZupT [Natronospora cellulosivora (SeqCode)]
MNFDTYSLPLLLTALGGLATGIGSLASLFFQDIKRKHLSVVMGFAAGVMIYISFAELLEESMEAAGFVPANIAFFGGILVMMLVDYLIPHNYLAEQIMYKKKKNADPSAKLSETMSIPEEEEKSEILSAGLMTAIGIAIHNFPEGVIVFISAVHDIRLGIALTIAIALHNIPEGFSIGMPILYATEDKKKTFFYSLAAGLAEPIGALLVVLFFGPFLTDYIVHLALGFVAGIMVFISFDELLPLSFKDSDPHSVVLGIIAGMFVMFATLIFVG